MVRYIYIILAIVFFSGCEPTTVSEDSVEIPEQKMQQNITQYDVPLRKLGDMLTATGEQDIYIAIGDITNKTLNLGKVPDDITGMLKTAFLNIGYKVHVFNRYEDLLRFRDNAYYIEGEISEFEQIKAYGNGLDTGLSVSKNDVDADADYSQENGTKVFNVSLDIRVMNAHTHEYLPFVFAKNKLKLVKKNKSRTFSFFILGNGFGMSGNFSKGNGIFSSLRLLSEFSVVEVIGKLKSVPYWLVLPNGKPDYKVINNFKRDFQRKSPQEQKMYIQGMLTYYYPVTLQQIDQNFSFYLQDIKKKFRMYPVDDTLSSELFAKLLVNLTKYSVKKQAADKRQYLLKSIMN